MSYPASVRPRAVCPRHFFQSTKGVGWGSLTAPFPSDTGVVDPVPVTVVVLPFLGPGRSINTFADRRSVSRTRQSLHRPYFGGRPGDPDDSGPSAHSYFLPTSSRPPQSGDYPVPRSFRVTPGVAPSDPVVRRGTADG